MKKPSLKLRHFDWTGLILETDLPPLSKYLCLYLAGFMNKDQNIAWPSLQRIIDETGLSKASICKYIDILERENWIIRERGNSTKNTRYIITFPIEIQKTLQIDGSTPHGLPSTPHGLRSTPHGLQVVRHTDTNSPLNNPINNKREKSKRFIPPSPKEVNDYCKQNGIKIDGSNFVDFYESKGWMVGKNKMKDWKAAVRTWAKRNRQEAQPNQYMPAMREFPA